MGGTKKQAAAGGGKGKPRRPKLTPNPLLTPRPNTHPILGPHWARENSEGESFEELRADGSWRCQGFATQEWRKTGKIVQCAAIVRGSVTGGERPQLPFCITHYNNIHQTSEDGSGVSAAGSNKALNAPYAGKHKHSLSSGPLRQLSANAQAVGEWAVKQKAPEIARESMALLLGVITDGIERGATPPVQYLAGALNVVKSLAERADDTDNKLRKRALDQIDRKLALMEKAANADVDMQSVIILPSMGTDDSAWMGAASPAAKMIAAKAAEAAAAPEVIDVPTPAEQVADAPLRAGGDEDAKDD